MKKKDQQRASHRYELTTRGLLLLEGDKLGPQPKLIAQALNRKAPATSAELVDAIESKVETRQPVMRVVSYYLTTWKAEGIVKVAKAKASKVAKKTKKAKPPASSELAQVVA